MMAHAFEIATSGRAKCRGCGMKIEKGALRFGERVPNAFGEGETTLWFHPLCAAYKRPEPLLEALRAETVPKDAVAREDLPDADALEAIAEEGVAHRRLPRVAGADRAPTGRARCRNCRELIEKGSWRIGLVFFEEFRFQPSGYIHAGCATDYLETVDLLKRIRHFNPGLSTADGHELEVALGRPPPD